MFITYITYKGMHTVRPDTRQLFQTSNPALVIALASQGVVAADTRIHGVQCPNHRLSIQRMLSRTVQAPGLYRPAPSVVRRTIPKRLMVDLFTDKRYQRSSTRTDIAKKERPSKAGCPSPAGMVILIPAQPSTSSEPYPPATSWL